ncbi:MAG: 4-hydroxy-tetrahydrodipicolinate synthase, partial [Clostridiales bacterium]|nr:4-hydroxy-tetrahydrodipicolinate synthase [Clostridiales bacterium]
MQFFKGVCTALSTPFTKDDVNVRTLEELLERQWEAGVDAVAVLGTTGEPSTMSLEEKIFTVKSAAEILRGTGLKLIAGAGSNSTDEAVHLARACEYAGAQALLVVTPYYNKATGRGVIRHYD